MRENNRLIFFTNLLVAFLLVRLIIEVYPKKPIAVPSPILTRIIELKGNTVVKTEDIKDGRFVFILNHQGVFYFNTTEGNVWSALYKDNFKTLSPEHQNIIKKNLIELEKE